MFGVIVSQTAQLAVGSDEGVLDYVDFSKWYKGANIPRQATEVGICHYFHRDLRPRALRPEHRGMDTTVRDIESDQTMMLKDPPHIKTRKSPTLASPITAMAAMRRCWPTSELPSCNRPPFKTVMGLPDDRLRPFSSLRVN
ncbi:MAG: hypothetical protein Q9210_004139 [Variospora velana]